MHVAEWMRAVSDSDRPLAPSHPSDEAVPDRGRRLSTAVEGADPRADPCPLPPPEPDAADCCGEGCVRCIYDLHEAALERYQLALEAWQTRHC